VPALLPRAARVWHLCEKLCRAVVPRAVFLTFAIVFDAGGISIPRRLAARANAGRDIGDCWLNHLRLVIAQVGAATPASH
jgi:hypothetical protein